MAKIPDQAFVELQAVYKTLEQDLEPYRRHCDMRGVCCNFAALGHMLYATALEAAEMGRAGLAPDAKLGAEGKCPFLNGISCGIRNNRALGCRIYYCDRTYEEERNEVYERCLKRVREIEARYGIAHSYQAVTQIDFSEFE